MKQLSSPRTRWLAWLAAVGLLVALTLFPVSSRATRCAGVALTAAVWFGLAALVWRRPPLRFAHLGVTALAAGFLVLPSREPPPVAVLRAEYVESLLRYEGVRYHWGGETSLGIDCSGLVRRGIVDAHLRRGVRTLDAGSVRRAIGLWWDDCTAAALGGGHDGLTVRRFDAPSVNEIDPASVLPGDLAVTEDGVHVFACVGGGRWIEADPGERRVLTVTTPSPDNPWFRVPVRVVRWSVLE